MRAILKHVFLIVFILLLSYILIYDLVSFFKFQTDSYNVIFQNTSNPSYLFESKSALNKMYLSMLFSSFVITPIVGQILLFFELDHKNESTFFSVYTKALIVGVGLFVLIYIAWLIQNDIVLIPALFWIVTPIYIISLMACYHISTKD